MEDGNLIVLLNSKILYAVREAIDSVAKLLIGPALPATYDGLLMGKKLKRFQKGAA